MSHLHSGHVHLAARQLPPLAADCTQIRATLDESALSAALTRIGGQLLLPDMPKEIIALEHEIGKAHPNLSHIAQLIDSNPAISGEILGTVSSPAFQRQLARPVVVHSLTQCIALIGLTRTYELAMAAAIRQMASDEGLVHDILAHAAKTAYACAEIAGYLPPHDPHISQEHAYLFGLFLHGGMLPLAARYPNQYAKVFEQSLTLPDSAHTLEQEKAASHALLGVLTAQRWGLNAADPAEHDLLLAIAWHHHPQAACIQQTRVRLLIGTGLLAQALVSEIGMGVFQSQELREQRLMANRLLGLPDETLANIRLNLASDWQRGTA